jgi:glucokinase
VLEENRVYRTLLDQHSPHWRLQNAERKVLAEKQTTWQVFERGQQHRASRTVQQLESCGHDDRDCSGRDTHLFDHFNSCQTTESSSPNRRVGHNTCSVNLLGIEIGGSKLQLVTGDETGRIRQRCRLVVDPVRGAEGIRRQIEQKLLALLQPGRIEAAGVGFGGPVDWSRGTICRSHQLAGWSGFDLVQWLQPQTNAPVFVDNDGNVAALGEATRGAGVGLNPVFYVTLGSGVGGGLVINGNIYHGAAPGESEIGHVRLDRVGTTVESRCSGWSVDARIRDLKITEPSGVLARLAAGETRGEAQHLTSALQQADATARRIVREVGEDLAFGLSHVAHLFHPEIIILGGGLAGVGEPLRASVECALRDLTMDAFLPGPKIRLAALGEDAVPVGALLLAEMNR